MGHCRLKIEFNKEISFLGPRAKKKQSFELNGRLEQSFLTSGSRTTFGSRILPLERQKYLEVCHQCLFCSVLRVANY